MQAIILAGGFGTRLKTVVKDVPKPMALIAGRPFLFYLLSHLKKYHFTDVVLSVGYLKEQIMKYFGENFLGINIKYAVEDSPLGTGGAIINSLKYVNKDEPVVILNGDTFLELDYTKLIDFHKNNKSNFTIALTKLEDCSRYGLVETDANDIVTSFKEKDSDARNNYINSGTHVINPRIFDSYDLTEKFSFEVDFVTPNLEKLKIKAFRDNHYFIDIGIPEDYQKSQTEIPNLTKNKALFLDRDGVINVDYGYVHKIENFDFVDGIFDLCKEAEEKGYLIIVVTNQAGIAREYYTEDDFLKLTNWMKNEFKKRGINS